MPNSPFPQYAGFWIRLIAAVIDMILTLPFLLAIIYLLGISDYQNIRIDQQFYHYAQAQAISHTNNITDLASWVAFGAYSVFLVTSKKQATWGKRICHIYVATKDGQRLTKLQAVARFITSIFSIGFFGIGILMIAVTKEKTAFHDLICQSRVFFGQAETINK
jgi:uncharacterized RDD family membrane protein YckC